MIRLATEFRCTCRKGENDAGGKVAGQAQFLPDGEKKESSLPVSARRENAEVDEEELTGFRL